MYAPYFGLKGEPFSIAPDPHFLFMSERHREALAHLLYGLGGGGGFVLLTGEIGTGKTTVCRLFLEQIPADCNVAYIFNPKLTVTELLQSICEEFHIELAPGASATVKDHVDALNAFLLREHAAGRNNVLIIDEAQNLAADVLEQLRLLTNLETRERKLLQIVLIGQPELRAMLAQPQLEQLAQRVIARYHLGPLTPEETARYVQHRLEVAGLDRPLPFERRALRRVHELSRGVPRRINLLCDRALLGAFANSMGAVDRSTVDKAASEVFDDGARAPKQQRAAAVLALGLVAGAGLYAAASHVAREPDPAPATASKPAAATAVQPKPLKVAVAAPLAASAPAAAPASATPPALLHDNAQAWRELAELWKVPVEAGDPCQLLAAKGLHCFARTLNLATIRELGRPGIVRLDAATGTPSYAVLTSLGTNTATLSAGGAQQTVTLGALASRWQGEFATLWKAPPGYMAGTALAGSAQPAPETVAWMADGLASSSGRAQLKGRQVLDAEMRAQLKSFQLAQGLNADGQPGPMTYMQLNRARGVEEPRLRSEP